MKALWTLVFMVVVLSLSSFTSGQTVLDLLEQNHQFSNFYNATSAYPDLVTLLNTTESVTVFAPNNNALTSPSGVSEEVIRYHLASGQYVEFTSGQLIPTLLSLSSLDNRQQRVKVSFNASKIVLNQESEVLQSFNATNGIIYEMNAVLTQPSNMTVILSQADLTNFLSWATRSNITFTEPIRTVFSPVNEAFVAFANAYPAFSKYLNLPQALTDLNKVVSYHAIGDIYYSTNFSTTPTDAISLEGSTLVLTNNSGNLTVNQAKIVTRDLLASNGVAHFIDNVLLPSNLAITLRKSLLGLNLTTLISALDQHQVSILDDPSINITLFAPTNDAFARTGAQVTLDLLQYHIHNSGAISYASLYNGQLIDSALLLSSLDNQFQKLRISVDQQSGNKSVNGVTLNVTNVFVSNNSIIYLVEEVISLPGNLSDTVANAPGSEQLPGWLAQADLLSLVSNGTLTLVAPLDWVWEDLPFPVTNYLLLPNGTADLITILSYFIVYGKVYYSTTFPLNTPIPTLNGENIVVNKVDGNLQVSNPITGAIGNISQSDNLASNGVFHQLDTFLFPASFKLTLRKLLMGSDASIFMNVLSQIDFAYLLDDNSTQYTIFAPTDEAFLDVHNLNDLVNNKQLLTQMVLSHIAVGSIPTLTIGHEYATFNNRTLLINSSVDGGTPVISLVGVDGSANVLTGMQGFAAVNGVVYSIDYVLDQPTPPPSGDGDGLSGTAIGFIIVGCIVAVLLVAAAIGGAIWWWRRKGYVQIGDF